MVMKKRGRTGELKEHLQKDESMQKYIILRLEIRVFVKYFALNLNKFAV